MERSVIGIVLAGALTLSAAGGKAQAPRAERASDVAAIRAHIESIFQAFIDKDLPTLEATHGADWRGFTSGSRQVIRGRDAYMKSGAGSARLPKGQGMVGYRISDFDVVFYGDTAVASFVADLDVVSGSDKGTQKLTLVDVYHKEPAGWIQVASNTSLHPDAIWQQMSQPRSLSAEERTSLLAAREAVWRAWYASDTTALGALVPAELVTIEPGDGAFGTRASVLESSRQFAATRTRLTRLEFPRTEIQAYGATVVLYTTYDLDLEHDGRTRTEHGAATEIFVLQNGRWLNTGWQLAETR